MDRTLDTLNRGTLPEAVIVDMDGTLENWDQSINSEGMAYVYEQHALGRVIVIVTARDHETCYGRTHRWLTANLTVPFVGPFCRSRDDARYASAFKQGVHGRLSHLYQIVGAIDDNEWVLAMWRELGVEAVQTFDAPPPRDPWADTDYYGDWWASSEEPDVRSPWWVDALGGDGRKRRKKRRKTRWR